MASDLALLVKDLVHAEQNTAEMLALDQGIAGNLAKLSQSDPESRTDSTHALFEAIRAKFQVINKSQNYQGMFVADGSGQILTGVLASGDEYAKISVAGNEDFKKAKQNGAVSVGEMIRSQATSQLVVPIAAPIRSKEGQFAGIVGLVLKLDVHSIQEMAGINEIMLGGKSGVAAYVFKGIHKIAGAAPVEINGWSIAVTQNADEFLQIADHIRNIILAVVLVALSLASLVLIVSIRKIVRPINAAVAGLKDIAQGEGNLTMRLQVASKDMVQCIY